LKPKLHSVSHYHNKPGTPLNPIQFQEGNQCIELLTGGRGWVEIEGEWVEVGPGDLLWHIRGDRTIGRSDPTNPYSCLAVRFRDEDDPVRRVPRLTRWEEIDEVRLFTRQVVQLHAEGGFEPQVLLRYILSRVHFQAELYLRIQRERGLPMELRQVMEVVTKRYAEPLRLGELAAAAGWSVPHLHDRFKERLGLSPHQAVIRRRMQVARELLASTNDPIKSVAAKCGFTTAASFCVQFRKSTQLSPKEYRERQLFGGSKAGSS
jgi:AraC-like DNA-binding protein